jgi:uncharacterized protein (DUF2267 family)
MSATGLDVFDKTLQTTNIWLDDIMKDLGPDRHVAWKVLSVVLHKLRDRLPVESAAHLSAELPLLIRGVYYDQYQPAKQPSRCRDMEEFCAEVQEWLSDTRPTDARDAVQCVFRVLSRHIPEGQIRKVQDTLPQDMRQWWRAIAADVAPPADKGERGRYSAAPPGAENHAPRQA